MKKIIEKVGRDRAVELVAQAYNTEMLTTLLNRLEEKKPKMIDQYNRRDQLADAIGRVVQICDLVP
jgi:hypothetical protein